MSTKVAVLAILIFVSSLSAQDNFIFEHLGVEDGLSQNDVRCILQDSRGLMWFGTRSGGLNLFNGFTFRYYNEGNSENNLSRNEIFGLAEDSEGNIWVSVIDGLERINIEDGTVEKFHHSSMSGKEYIHDFTSTLCLDKSNRIWINSVMGLSYFDLEKNNYTYFPTDIFNKNSYQVEVTPDGTVWVCSTDNLLHKYNEEKKAFERINLRPSSKVKKFATIAMSHDTQGRLYICSSIVGVIRYDPATLEIETLSDELSRYIIGNGLEVDSMNVCSHGNLWIGNRWGGGLIRYDLHSGQYRVIKKEYSDQRFRSNHIDCIYEDSLGNHWFGFRSGGVVKITESKFSKIVPQSYKTFGTTSDSVRALTLDSQGDLWVGTDDDISIINREKRSIVKILEMNYGNQKVDINSTYILEETSPGKMLVGGIGLGLSLLDKRTMKSKLLVSSPHIRHISKDIYGGYWLSQGRMDVLHIRFDNNLDVIKTKLPDDLYRILKGKYVRSINVSRDNTAWFGTNKGLISYQPEDQKIVFYESNSNDPNAIHGENIFSSLEDQDGCIWAGSAGRGISILDRRTGKCRHLTADDGLPDNVIYQIVEDEEGTIWVATNAGIASINPNGKIQSFGVKDGIHGPEFNVGASYISPEGEIFLGGIGGLSYFHPREIVVNRSPAKVFVSSFTSAKKQFSSLSGHYTEENLNIQWEDRDLKFEFSTSDNTVLKSAKFKYKLVGYDRNWKFIDRENLAFYTNIPAGKHELLVQAANSNGVYGNVITVLEFRIQSPYWQTWWFYSLAAVTSILLIYGLVFWRIQRIKTHRDLLRKEVESQTKAISEQKQELENINKELHAFSYSVSHDIRAPIYRILNYCQFLEEDHADKLNKEGNLFIGKIKDDAAKANQLVEDLLTLSRIEKQEITRVDFDLIKVIKSVLSNLTADHKDCKIKVNMPEKFMVNGDIGLINIAMENLLGNAVKFTSKTSSPEITIEQIVVDGEAAICIRDNGAGFDQAKAEKIFEPFERLHTGKEFSGSGVGLSTVKKIIKRHNGWIKAEGEKGKGAAFYFTL